ncbi:MAG: hypothetical protein ABIP97_06815 [Chthoniobacterales bacterium]
MKKTVKSSLKKSRTETEGRLTKSDREFLEHFKDKWFYADIAKLLQLENRWAVDVPELEIENMPDWAARLVRELFLPFRENLGLLDMIPAEFITTEQFAKALGAKMRISWGFMWFINSWDRADTATRAKLTKLAGSPEDMLSIRKTLPMCKRIEQIFKVASRRLHNQPFEDQGKFWRGYGTGLLISEALRNWMKQTKSGKRKQAFIRAHVFFAWPFIEDQRKTSGWSDILQDFQNSLPDDLEISEDTFRKTLQRAGMKDVGHVGRPRKQGQKSTLPS